MNLNINFTDALVKKVNELKVAENSPNLKLRLFVQGGGCAGLQYGFTFEEKANDDDFVINKNGLDILVDSVSVQYLDGAEVDYNDDDLNAQFVIRNPHVQTGCGCGKSFGI